MSVKTANRDINSLDKDFKKKVELFLGDLEWKIFITEAHRTQERQDYLYSLGRTVPGKVVTWTRNSNHKTGKAIDIAFIGVELYPADIYKWREVADIAEKYGIDWGFDLWGNDKPHFQDNWVPLDESWEYRILVGESVFSDTEKAWKTLVEWTPDERIAIVEKIAERVTEKILKNRGIS